MLRLLADENFNGRILRALKRQIPDLDVVRAQDTPLSGADDPALLEFAADEKRPLLIYLKKQELLRRAHVEVGLNTGGPVAPY
jgi:Domain of unknown function (DUF5615)